jgi:hypothetical protein
MRYFDENLVANSRPHAGMWGQVCAQREAFHRSEEAHAPLMANALAASGLRNNAAIIPRDAWREMDDITMRVMRGDDGEAYMSDLMPLARAVNIGKIQFGYRVSSDAGVVRRSISGQVPDVLGKVDYDYRFTTVPVFNTSYGRSWREWNSMQSENFDALMDDQEAHVHAIRTDMAAYALDGDDGVVFNGTPGYGIRNHPMSKSINLGTASGGASIDLAGTSTTSDQIETFINGPFGALLDENEITEPVNIYVSREIMRRWDRPYSAAGGFKEGALWEYVQRNRRINKVAVTSKLSGNEIMWFVPSPRFIRPLIGMAVNTTAMIRSNPVDDYNFLVMGAMGIDIRADYNEKSGVGYSVVVN